MEEDIPDGNEERPIERMEEGPLLPDLSDWPEAISDNNLQNGEEQAVSLDFLSSLLHSVEESGTTGQSGTSESPESEENIPDWTHLPHVVLSVIFSKLRDRDKASAARTCKSWLEGMSDPSLWRSRHLRFGNSCVNGRYTQRALGFARKYGQHLQRLTLQCMHPTYSVAKKFQSSMTSFLHALNTKKADNRRCELREFTMNQLHVERYWRFDNIRERLISAFCRFLKKQYRLTYVDVSEVTLNAVEGLRILETLGEAAGRRIKVLNMEDFFGSRLSIYSVPRYRLVMSHCHNLNSLITNYNYLSEEIIDLLAANCQRKLKCLSIKVYRLDPYRHIIHPHTWRMLRRACPGLRVCLYFEAIGAHADITRIACSELPLKVVQIWTGMNLQDEYWSLGSTIRYLGNTFSRTLEEACLFLENPREDVDDALLHFLEKCRHLEVLDIQGALAVSTIDTICEWQEKYKIGLQRCHISADNLTSEEVEQLDAVVEKYRAMLDHRGLDFQLLANPGF